MRFLGQTAVVVGGSTGWGRSCASRLAQDGAHVVIVDADESRCLEAVETIAARGDSAVCALADPADMAQMKTAGTQALGRDAVVHALVANHMRLDWASVEDCDLGHFEAIVHYNLVGPVAAVKAFLPMLKRAQGAAIVLLGSVDGLYGNPRVASYSASKAGLVPLTRIMAHEFAPYEIRVNAIASAHTNQPTEEQLSGPPPQEPGWEGFPGTSYYRQLADATPLKRYGTGEEWAGAVSFLASDDAAYVTGSVLVVDCGRTGLTAGTY